MARAFPHTADFQPITRATDGVKSDTVGAQCAFWCCPSAVIASGSLFEPGFVEALMALNERDRSARQAE